MWWYILFKTLFDSGSCMPLKSTELIDFSCVCSKPQNFANMQVTLLLKPVWGHNYDVKQTIVLAMSHDVNIEVKY